MKQLRDWIKEKWIYFPCILILTVAMSIGGTHHYVLVGLWALIIIMLMHDSTQTEETPQAQNDAGILIFADVILCVAGCIRQQWVAAIMGGALIVSWFLLALPPRRQLVVLVVGYSAVLCLSRVATPLILGVVASVK